MIRDLFERRGVLVVLGLVFAAYSGVPEAGFVWDDHALLEHNLTLDEPTFERIWQRDLWCCVGTGNSGYYRPLLTLSFLLDRTLFGVSPAASHVHSLLWHLLAVSLAWTVLRPRLGELRAQAAALVFGLHPIQCEAVVWISARNDLMAAAGVLATLAAADRGRPVLAGVFTLAACLSKENAYLMPGLLWVWRRAFGEGVKRSEMLAIGLGLAVAFAMRSQATLGGFTLDQNAPSFNATSALYAVVTFFKWVTLPWPLTSTASLLMQPPGALDWLAAVGTLGALGWCLRAAPRRSGWLLVFAAAVFAPALIGMRWYATVGERYLYFPMFGIAVVAVAAAPAGRAAWAAISGATVAALLALHVHVSDWANEGVLFSQAVRRAPDSFSWNLLGVELGRQSRWPEAMQAYESSLAAEPYQRLSCKFIADVGARVLDPESFAARVPVWRARGCRRIGGFDSGVALHFIALGKTDEAAEIMRTTDRVDPFGRDQIVRGTLAALEGDQDTLAGLAVTCPAGAAYFLDQVYAITHGTP